MGSHNSLDVSKNIIATLIRDVQKRHGLVFDTRNLRLTLSKVERRLQSEGISFLTKTLPRLCKAFDKALCGFEPLNSVKHGFKSMPDSKLPRFLGELFSQVLGPDGELLPNPDATCVESIRQILLVFYKYELPYTDEQVQQVISRFKTTEDELETTSHAIDELSREVDALPPPNYYRPKTGDKLVSEVARGAKDLLSRFFRTFDPTDIRPRHGPGAVATRQQLWAKFEFTNVSKRITAVYPLDAYFFASLGHVCDRMELFNSITDEDLPARVCLVPKDSRGPRLISCEPVDFQWVQQGLGRAIVERAERHHLTRWNVFFTDQTVNQRGAWLGSKTGRYATLDLNEASDRISLSLVRLLFPDTLIPYLEGCRSTSTELPDGQVLPLRKYAPMGSCLCFPVLALSVWAILTAGAPDADTREGIAVYGDDIVVPTAYAVNAMKLLESFGLKVNQDKSCTSGLFRESCGTDAFQGVNVTPVRIRTVWESSPSPDVYMSWIAYANSFYDRQYYHTYDAIVEELIRVYGSIPDDSMSLTCASLREVPELGRVKKRRWNRNLQKFQYLTYTTLTRSLTREIDGWSMLLRYFTEACPPKSPDELVSIVSNEHERSNLARSLMGELTPKQALVDDSSSSRKAFSVRRYTRRKTSMLVKRWL